MAPALAFDLTRLFLGPIHRTPRGIDRHDMGLATHFFRAWPGDCFGTLPAPLGVRMVPRSSALKMLERLDAHWGEESDPDREPRFAAVKEKIVRGTGGVKLHVPVQRSSAPATVMGLFKIARHAECFLGRRATAGLPQGTVYLNTGQTGIAVPWFLKWLKQRPDVKPVIMLHDIIPLEHGEYVPPSSIRFHQNMVDNAARYAAGLIVTTKAAEAAILRELKRSGRSDMQIFSAHAPVPKVFADGPDPDPELAAAPYFVIAGAIEPRKNHMLVLNVWRELVAREGRAAPKLVVIGTRWRAPAGVTDILERSNALKDHVIEASGLSSPALKRLFSNACALLMPSFAEGFGLPIVEALALGTPAIASDIEAHREAGGTYATYLSPIDGVGWLAAIQSHVKNRSAYRQKLSDYKKWTWADYHKAIEPFLVSVHAGLKPAVQWPTLLPAPQEAATRVPS